MNGSNGLPAVYDNPNLLHPAIVNTHNMNINKSNTNSTAMVPDWIWDELPLLNKIAQVAGGDKTMANAIYQRIKLEDSARNSSSVEPRNELASPDTTTKAGVDAANTTTTTNGSNDDMTSYHSHLDQQKNAHQKFMQQLHQQFASAVSATAATEREQAAAVAAAMSNIDDGNDENSNPLAILASAAEVEESKSNDSENENSNNNEEVEEMMEEPQARANTVAVSSLLSSLKHKKESPESIAASPEELTPTQTKPTHGHNTRASKRTSTSSVSSAGSAKKRAKLSPDSNSVSDQGEKSPTSANSKSNKGSKKATAATTSRKTKTKAKKSKEKATPKAASPQAKPGEVDLSNWPAIDLETANIETKNAIARQPPVVIHKEPIKANQRGIARNGNSGVKNNGKNKKALDILTFPTKLHQVLTHLERENMTNIASFVNDGKAFIIYNQKQFKDAVLGKFFNMTTYESFQRQLNHYQFQRINHGPLKGSYEHPWFDRAKPYLTFNMKQQRKKYRRDSDGRHVVTTQIAPHPSAAASKYTTSGAPAYSTGARVPLNGSLAHTAGLHQQLAQIQARQAMLEVQKTQSQQKMATAATSSKGSGSAPSYKAPDNPNQANQKAIASPNVNTKTSAVSQYKAPDNPNAKPVTTSKAATTSSPAATGDTATAASTSSPVTSTATATATAASSPAAATAIKVEGSDVRPTIDSGKAAEASPTKVLTEVQQDHLII